MAHWQVNIHGKGIRKASVEKLVEKLREEFGEGVSISTQDNTPPESRQDRFQAALGLVSDCRSEIESLKDELDEWYNNLPENFQNGDKGQELQDAVSELEDLMSTLEYVEGTDITFPSMF